VDQNQHPDPIDPNQVEPQHDLLQLEEVDAEAAAAQLRLQIDGLNRTIAALEKAQQVTQETLQLEVSV
jgi:hypothetical protein